MQFAGGDAVSDVGCGGSRAGAEGAGESIHPAELESSNAAADSDIDAYSGYRVLGHDGEECGG